MSRPAPRPAPLIFGLLLVGLGGSAATAVQTPLSLIQSASIWLLVCAVVILVFLIGRGRNRAASRA